MRLLKRLYQPAIALLLLLLLLGLYATQIEPQWIQVKTVRVPIANLAPAFNGYRIVQLSDIHVDRWMTGQRLKDVVAIANRQNPDLVALTGDFITRNPKRFAAALRNGLQGWVAKDGAIAVLGNHDHWHGADTVEQALIQAKVQVLRNAVQPLRRGSDTLNIAGLDDYWVGATQLEPVLAQLPPTGATVLLIHEPDYADISAATNRFDLQLSGHSHGGQIQIPFWGPPVLPRFGQKYPVGRYTVGNMTLYTNRGVGAVKPRARFNSRPEITVFVLESA